MFQLSSYVDQQIYKQTYHEIMFECIQIILVYVERQLPSIFMLIGFFQLICVSMNQSTVVFYADEN